MSPSQSSPYDDGYHIQMYHSELFYLLPHIFHHIPQDYHPMPMLLPRSIGAVLSVSVRGLSRSTINSSSKQIKNVTIIGSGLMGSGIAQVTAQAQLDVILVDKEDKILERARTAIKKSVERVANKKFIEDQKAQKAFISDTISKIKTTTNVQEAVKRADLVIEAIVENLEAKQKVFDEIEANSSSATLMATNTSSLRLRDVAAHLKRKSQFGGLHFFNPVPVMKLLEIVKHSDTSDQTHQAFLAYGKAIGKITVSCKDTPGFIVNRLLVPYMFDALRMYERGDASMRDIDTAMKLGAGYPMGPFELLDYVGLDTSKFIVDGWNALYPDEPSFKPSATLNRLVSQGKLGRKSGEGFYSYK
ncbi:hypothetical protein AB6A40_003873 [Gnathostoma spinigerum]|uniref:3-hydroxyacyl-CoA dehydrogenase n=1 Tax=Gnathostoma spinigerum TaxID=75299 RepID=A0ABD6EIJ6_9BILA